MNIEPVLCRVNDALDILVGKWKPVILLQLIKYDKQRFSELKRGIPGITQKNADEAIARAGRRYY